MAVLSHDVYRELKNKLYIILKKRRVKKLFPFSNVSLDKGRVSFYLELMLMMLLYRISGYSFFHVHRFTVQFFPYQEKKQLSN